MDDLVIIDSYEKEEEKKAEGCGHVCEECIYKEENKEEEKAVDEFSFEIESGYMIISDPCCDLSKTRPEAYTILAVGKSTWVVSKIERVAYAPLLTEMGSISSITLYRKGFMRLAAMNRSQEGRFGVMCKFRKGEKIGPVAVDSGQVVLCDLPVYRKDEGIEEHELWKEYEIRDEPGEVFYSKMCNMTVQNPSFGCFKGGCVTSSGGDGSYMIYGKFYDDMLVEIKIEF